MQLIFGKGDILVTQCGNSELQHVIFEQGRGNGELGAKNLQHADRQEGAEIQPEDIENATVSFTFDNPVSCAVVLEKLLVNMVAFRKAEKFIGAENADLAESIKFLWAELLGEHDEPVAE